MRRDEFLNLKRGDIVQNIGSGDSFVIETVTQHNGSYHFLGVRTCLITNADEWKQVPSILEPAKFYAGGWVRHNDVVYQVKVTMAKHLILKTSRGNEFVTGQYKCVPVRRVIKPFSFIEAVKAVAEKGVDVQDGDGKKAEIVELDSNSFNIHPDNDLRILGYHYTEVPDWTFTSDNSPFGIVTYEDIT